MSSLSWMLYLLYQRDHLVHGPTVFASGHRAPCIETYRDMSKGVSFCKKPPSIEWQTNDNSFYKRRIL